MKNDLRHRLSPSRAAALLLLLCAAGLFAAPGLRREIWTNLDGPAEVQLKDRPSFFGPPLTLTTSEAYYGPPATADILANAISPNIYGGNYGSRLRGYVTAPVTGDYIFWEDGPDTVAVYLSVDENPTGVRMIVAHSGLAIGQVRAFPQRSMPVRLEAGRRYYLEVIQKSDSTNGDLALSWQLPSGLRQIVPMSALETYNPPAANPAGLTREIFPNIPGTALAALTEGAAFYRLPASTDVITSSSFSGFGQNYGMRLRGYLTAPVSGDYLFQETGSGDVSVSLATDENATALHQSVRLNDRPNKKEIAHHRGSLGASEWDKVPDQVSKPVKLIAGKKYYLEISFKTGLGADHLSIAWKVPGSQWGLIPLTALESYTRPPSDLDDDGMPDAMETAYGLDPTDAADASGDLDGDGIFNDEEIRAGSNPAQRDSVNGLVLDDRWKAVPGAILDQSAYRAAYTRPIGARSASVAMLVSGGGSEFVRRIRGYLTAPMNGEYTFWAGATGDCAFSLSSTASKFDRQQLIKTAGRIPYGRLDTNATQKSSPVTLVGGEKYYFEVWHKQGDGHATLAVAWQVPGEPRQTIPARYISSYVGDPNDGDDDDLPDDWEVAHGLNSGDDGRQPGSQSGAYGDLDGDGLTNLQERMLGTLPDSVDSNGNGVSDWDEANFNHSDLLAGSVGAFAAVSSFPGDGFTSSTGIWEKKNGQAWQRGLRGTLTYPVTVTQSGVHALRFTVSSRQDGGLDEGYDFRVSLNGRAFSYQTVTIPENGASAVAVLTPWLRAGETYQFEIFVDNSYNNRRISVDGLEVLAASGVDSNANGVPDWVEIRLGATNGFDQMEINSRTSPATVEGRARYFDLLNSRGVTVTKAPNGRFFSEVSLAPGEVRELAFDFENKAVSQTATVRWEPTNILQNPEAITLRAGDSLLLTAMRSAPQAAQETYSLTVNGQTITGTGEDSSPVAFPIPGAQTIELTHNGATGTVTTRSVSVTVLPRVDVGRPLCITRFARKWTHAPLPAGAELQLDSNVTAWREPAANTYTLISTIPQAQPMLVRYGAGGPILGGGAVQSASVRSDDYTGYLHQGMAGALLRVGLPVVLTGELQGAEIRCDIYIGGVTFLDGSTSKSLWEADFDENGVAGFTFLKAAAAHSSCHQISFWHDGVPIAKWN